MLSKGIMQAFKDFWWEDKILSFDEGVGRSQEINGINFISLATLLEYKKDMKREKDLQDVVLIENYLKMDLKDTYNTIAEDWVKDHDRDTWWQEGTDYFLSLLAKDSKVLDVGCGGGIKTRYILEKGYRSIGIDFSEKMIEIAKRESPEIDFKIIDMYDIDKLEETFDGIFVQAALLHIPKARVLEVLTKMKEELNPEGLLYIAVKTIRDDGIEEAVKTENDYGYDYDRFFSYFSLDELKEYFKQLALEVVWEGNKGSNQTNWIQIIGKRTA